MNVAVLYYDGNTPKEELKASADTIVDILEDTRVLVLPKNFDLLLNCSADQLLHIRSIIDTALAYKVQEMQAQANPVSIEKVDNQPNNNIIDITKYLS